LNRFRGSRPGAVRFALECGLGILGSAVVFALAQWLGWPAIAAAPVCLAIVAALAARRGFWPAMAASLAPMFAQALTLARAGANREPVAADIVTSMALVLVALVVSRLSARAVTQTVTAKSWEEQLRSLNEFTRLTLAMNLHVEPGPQLAELVQEIFALEAVVLFDADLHETYEAGYWAQDSRELAQNVYYFETRDDDRTNGLARRVLRLGSVPIGSMVLRGGTSPATNDAIALLIATTFDRYRAFANESQMETERRTEQLRATVLDSLAHAYKTPLTAIRAASTGLGEMGGLSTAQEELIALIDEQAGVLSELTTQLLTTAGMDAGKVTLDAAPVKVSALIDEVIAGLRERLASMKLSIQLEDENLELCCDRRLVGTLLTQYIDNACKYSHYGTTVTIGAGNSRAETIFSVHSHGPEIPPADRERIFDRYYRSSTSSHGASGTGIGLAVAKRAAQMHGGHVWVSSDETLGTTFFAAIPTRALERPRP
jgi:two-component system, OmpR family, sensor histidine kinase KdpD